MTEDILDLMEKGRKVKKKKRQKCETNLMKPRRSGSMTSTETSNYATGVLSRQ